LVEHKVTPDVGKDPQLGKQKAVLLLCVWCGMFLELSRKGVDGAINGDALWPSFYLRFWRSWGDVRIPIS
jgi:hypothetical protein